MSTAPGVSLRAVLAAIGLTDAVRRLWNMTLDNALDDS